MGFQTEVNVRRAIGVAGDFASRNPRATVLAGADGFVAGPGGVTVGKFAWVDVDGKTVLSRGTTGRVPDGFVHREQQALIESISQEASMVIPEGRPVTLHRSGDFFAVNAGAGAFSRYDQVYANYADGSIAQSAATNASATGSIGATFSATGVVNNLTVTSVTGLISVGDTVAGSGIPVGTTIVSQTSGTTGGAGVYVTSEPTTISDASATSFGDKLRITAVASGSLDLGEAVTGLGVPSGAVLVAQVSGATGGTGVYTISARASAYAASTAITSVGGIITGWTASSAVGVGELVKISKGA